MKNRMKKLTALGLSALMCFSVTACGGGAQENSQSGGQAAAPAESADSGAEAADADAGAADTGSDTGDKVITFWNVGTEGADKETYEMAIRQFEENSQSGYTIENIPTQNDKYKEKLVIAMSSGECPDMYTTWSGGPMNEYIDSGYAQPLDDLYEKYGMKERFMEGALEQASYNGQLYAIPVKNISIAGIYYNKALFEQCGVSVPTTVSELEAACDTFLAKGIIPFTLANGPKWTGSMYFQCLAARKGGLDPFQKAAAGDGTFEDESFVYAGEKEKVGHIFERFCMAVESYNLSARYARSCCFELASSVYFARFSDTGNSAREKLSELMQAVSGADRERACQVTAMFLENLFEGEDGEVHELIGKVKRRIHENLADDLTVASLAEQYYVTPNYLSRLFKRVTGEGCNEYIVRKRIEQAKSLLSTTTLKVGEISIMVGYHDMNYFSLAFKKHIGVSPVRYREQVQRRE